MNAPHADIDILREMIRLAENRRSEEIQAIERLIKYNLALIAFSGSFLSLLLTTTISKPIVEIAGWFLLVSVASSLLAIRPRSVFGGTLVVSDDVKALRKGESISLREYLLETADLLEQANAKIAPVRRYRAQMTIFSAILLALALFATYALYVYA